MISNPMQQQINHDESFLEDVVEDVDVVVL